MKMKISVIFGVTQMSLGIFMKAFNAFHFRSCLDFCFEFVPQIILLWVLFGWMNLLIIAKWLTHWEDPLKAPGIISVMINMFLAMGKTDEGREAIIGSEDVQQVIQNVLLVVALI
jgi:V-type H+-transporting ATPase subunit a